MALTASEGLTLHSPQERVSLGPCVTPPGASPGPDTCACQASYLLLLSEGVGRRPLGEGGGALRLRGAPPGLQVGWAGVSPRPCSSWWGQRHKVCPQGEAAEVHLHTPGHLQAGEESSLKPGGWGADRPELKAGWGGGSSGGNLTGGEPQSDGGRATLGRWDFGLFSGSAVMRSRPEWPRRWLP